MISFWQSMPEHLHPIAFSLGNFPVRYYGLSYLAGFFSVWMFLFVLLKREGREIPFRDLVLDGLVWIFFGALIGGRLGYALFYEPMYFWQHPLQLVFPFGDGSFTGFFGMSFFGGVVGVIISLWFFVRRTAVPFFVIADYYALAVPIALFFGRLGNFMNGELYGRITNVPWGMYFPLGGMVLRHPSQLYEATFEGVALFCLVYAVRRITRRAGRMSVSFLLGYAFFRFWLEYFREPDPGQSLLFGYGTEGQLFSMVLFFSSGWFWYSMERKKSAILEP